MADTSLDNPNGLTPPENTTVTPGGESTPGVNGLSPNNEGEVVDEKTKQGFQRLIAKKDQEISSASARLAAAEKERDALRKAEQDRKLSELSEVERLRAEKDEYATKFAKSELKLFVTAELEKRGLMKNPLAEDIIESPWLLKAVRSHLPDQPDWDQTIAAVKEYLPTYLDTLVVPDNAVPTTPVPSDATPSDTTPPTVPTGRTTPPATPTSKRIWTKTEIDKVRSDTDQWLKYRGEITEAYNEGRVV